MAEKLKQSHEHGHETSPAESAEARKNLERLHLEAQEAKAEQESVEALKKTAQEAAKSREEMAIEKEQDKEDRHLFGVHKELKADAYKRTLETVKKELKPAEKTFSSFIHLPSVEKVSELSSKTIARPSALLGGGACAFLGTSIVLYMSKHYGFTYNTSLFFVLFVLGFAVGIALELGLRVLSSKRSR